MENKEELIKKLQKELEEEKNKKFNNLIKK